MDDNQIIELYFRRDEQAIAHTADKYGHYCYRIAYNILAQHESSEEAVNDTYVRAWNSIPPTRPKALAAYLGKITRNISLSTYRMLHSEKRGNGELPAVLDELGECVPSRQDTEAAFEQRELARCINAFLGTLGDTERNIFVARYWYLAGISEIGNRFQFSESKVKSMLFRTRKKLLDYLRQEVSL